MIYTILVVMLVLSMCAGVLWRNSCVYKFRMDLLNKIARANHRDIENGNYHWQWRYEKLNEVSYKDMILQFWRSLESFYGGVDFKL